MYSGDPELDEAIIEFWISAVPVVRFRGGLTFGPSPKLF